MSLLDDVVKKTVIKKTVNSEKNRLEAYAQGLVDRYDGMRHDPNEVQIDRGHRKWHGDPRITVAGLGVGHLIEFVNCGAELDGQWKIVKVETETERAIVASRNGRPPYARMVEADVRAEIREGRLRIIGR